MEISSYFRFLTYIMYDLCFHLTSFFTLYDKKYSIISNFSLIDTFCVNLVVRILLDAMNLKIKIPGRVKASSTPTLTTTCLNCKHLFSRYKKYLRFSLALAHFIPSWLVWAKSECTVQIALPKWPINQFKNSSAKKTTSTKSLLS